MKRWYVVQTHLCAENRAGANLERQGFDVYCPVYERRRSHARKVETVRASLFPGYLFVAMDVEAQRWRAVLSTQGVRRLVSQGTEPVAIANAVIDEIRGREDADGLVRVTLPAVAFASGSKVTIDAGRTGALSALFVEMDDQRRAVVLVDILGRLARVELHPNRLSSRGDSIS